MSTAERPHLGRGADEADVAGKVRLVRLDGARVLAEQIGRDHAVDVPLDRGWPLAGLAKTNEALVGVHLHPQLAEKSQ
jgi:hypothetical protein